MLPRCLDASMYIRPNCTSIGTQQNPGLGLYFVSWCSLSYSYRQHNSNIDKNPSTFSQVPVAYRAYYNIWGAFLAFLCHKLLQKADFLSLINSWAKRTFENCPFKTDRDFMVWRLLLDRAKKRTLMVCYDLSQIINKNNVTSNFHSHIGHIFQIIGTVMR